RTRIHLWESGFLFKRMTANSTTSVDVTGACNIASQIAFGGADRRAQLPISFATSIAWPILPEPPARRSSKPRGTASSFVGRRQPVARHFQANRCDLLT